MKLNKFGSIKPLAAAIGLGLAVAASPASAAINWGNPFTLFEDDDVDFLIKGAGNTQADIIEVGDSLVAIAEIGSANGVDIGPGQELTAVAVIDVLSFATIDAVGALNDIVFGPNAAFNASLGGLYPGAMVAFWLDNTPNLNISAGEVVAGTTSCLTLALCESQARDGTLWQVDGFEGGTAGLVDADEFWVALNAQTNTAVVDGANPSTDFGGSVNVGLSILYNGTGQNLVENMVDCTGVTALSGGSLCAGDGMVDMLASGSIKGGGESFSPGSEWFATSDFDFTKKREIPEPASLALLAVGLLGVGASVRRRRS